MERYIVYQGNTAVAAFRLYSDAFDYMDTMKEEYPSLPWSYGVVETGIVGTIFEDKED